MNNIDMLVFWMGYGKRPYRVYLNGLYFPASPFSVLQPFLILWALCCPAHPLYWQNEYLHTAAPQGVWCVCAGGWEGVFRQLTYVGTPELQPLYPLLTHTGTQGLILPPAVWRGWLAHLPSRSNQAPCWARHGRLTVCIHHVTTAPIWKASTTTREGGRWRQLGSGGKTESRTVKTNMFHTSEDIQSVKVVHITCLYVRLHPLAINFGHTASPQAARMIK